MSNITYGKNENGFDKPRSCITVYLDGRRAGTIEPAKGGWQYYPKGQKQGGEVFSSVSEVKRSIEGE